MEWSTQVLKKDDCGWGGWERTTLGSNDTTLFQGSVEKLKIRFLEQRLCWTFGVTAVGDDDVEFVFAVGQKLETVADKGLDGRVLVANGHSGQVLLADTDDGFVNVAEDGLFDRLVFDNLTQNTAVTTTNHEDGFGVGVGVHGQVCDHLLIRKLVAFGALDDVVKDEDGAVVTALKDQDVLIF